MTRIQQTQQTTTMPVNMIQQIQQAFTLFLQTTFKIDNPELSQCAELVLNVDENKQQFGDLNANAAMILAKALKQNPRAIAEQIATNFTHPGIARIEIAGPGFLNFFFTEKTWHTLAQNLYNSKEEFFTLDSGIPRYRYNVEFVSANPTGPLHLGHGRGGIIGDVLANILNFIGHSATREFYINDAGTQIDKLGRSFKIRCQQELGASVELPEDGYHGTYLVDLAKECIAQHGSSVTDKPETFFQEYAQQKLLAHIKQTLAQYGIQFDVWFSEKTLHTDGSITSVINLLQEHGYLFEHEGALWFRSTTFGDDKDRVMRKASGELTYVAADTAYLKNKVDRGFDHLIMVLGQDHHSYVVRLQGLLLALHLHTKAKLDVILYQLVSLKEGDQQLRMSKRAGRIISLADVIETVGVDIARFFYLHRKADAHLEFDIELALKKTDENPVYYAQYAYVRIKSILEKSSQDAAFANISPADAEHIGTEEQLLLKKIISLKKTLESISHNHQTHVLTYYVLELAQAFHSYYGKHRVINVERVEQSRGRLVVMQLLKNNFDLALTLLGISLPETM
ncbi:MAG TPA: arginine--tRNA ligase [Candidatus Babeliales bacterium]|nr:arginine--tRNA ligase [Candidatus Babeliales bacterium]